MPNVVTPITAGTILASDDVSGVLYPRTKISFGADGSAVDVSNTNPYPMTIRSSGYVEYNPWNGTSTDTRGFNAITISVSSLSGGDSYIIEGSNTGAVWFTLTGIKQDLTTVTSITTNGIYVFAGYGYLRFTKTGLASTPVVSLLLKA